MIRVMDGEHTEEISISGYSWTLPRMVVGNTVLSLALNKYYFTKKLSRVHFFFLCSEKNHEGSDLL